MKLLFLIALAASLVRCTATMVNSPAISNSPFAPVNEASRGGGTVKYLNQGADFVIRSRREDAYKQMYESCNGKYRIDSEGQRAEGGYAMKVTDSMSAWGETSYWYITFSCFHSD